MTNAKADDSRPAEQFITHLSHLIKSVQLYPSGHSMLNAIIEKFFSELQNLLRMHSPLSVRIYENTLYVGAHPLPTSDHLLLQEMQKRYIRCVTVKQDVELPDICALLDVLLAADDKIADMGGAARLFAHNGGKHIDLIEYYSLHGTTVDDAALAELINSELFQFLINNDQQTVTATQARRLYDLLKNPYLTAAVLKAAGDYLRRQSDTAETEHDLLCALIKKTAAAIRTAELSEAAELKSIMRDVVSALEQPDFFTLIFFHSDDEHLAQLGLTPPLLAERLSPAALAELIAAHTPAHALVSVVAHVKTVLSRMFINRQQLLSFLPVFKDKLNTRIGSAADQVMNDICSAFAVGFNLEQNIELALGDISECEQQELVAGLAILKTVQIDKSALCHALKTYNDEDAYFYIVQSLLSPDVPLPFFQHCLEELIGYLHLCLEKQTMRRGAEIFSALQYLVSPDSPLSGDMRSRIINSPNKIPAPLIETYVAHVISTEPPIAAVAIVQGLFLLMTDYLVGIIAKLYIRQDDIPCEQELRDFICAHPSATLNSLCATARQEPAGCALRLITLLTGLPAAIALPCLWELTYHDDRQVAQQALRSIVEKKNPESVTYLFQALDHPLQILRLAAVEHLAGANYPDVSNRLTLIARGQASCLTPDNTLAMRLRALESLRAVNNSAWRNLLSELRGRKKYFFFPAEHKAILGYIRAAMPEKTP